MSSLTLEKVLDIQCTKALLPEFPHLLFGETNAIEGASFYFDATHYLENTKLPCDVSDAFFVNYAHPIRALMGAYGIDPSEIKATNSDGHLLINSALAFLFLSWTDPMFLQYINQQMEELFRKGFTVSDTYLVCTIENRFGEDAKNRFLSTDNVKTLTDMDD